jgi:hypothetical protein
MAPTPDASAYATPTGASMVVNAIPATQSCVSHPDS